MFLIENQFLEDNQYPTYQLVAEMPSVDEKKFTVYELDSMNFIFMSDGYIFDIKSKSEEGIHPLLLIALDRSTISVVTDFIVTGNEGEQKASLKTVVLQLDPKLFPNGVNSVLGLIDV